MDILAEQGYGANSMWLHPLYKDWNEQLKAEHGVTAILPQTHPKKDAYHTIARKTWHYECQYRKPLYEVAQTRISKEKVWIFI